MGRVRSSVSESQLLVQPHLLASTTLFSLQATLPRLERLSAKAAAAALRLRKQAPTRRAETAPFHRNCNLQSPNEGHSDVPSAAVLKPPCSWARQMTHASRYRRRRRLSCAFGEACWESKGVSTRLAVEGYETRRVDGE